MKLSTSFMTSFSFIHFIFGLTFSFICTTISFSQYKFQKTFNGLTFYNGHQTPDSGYIVTGSTKFNSTAYDDFFILKLNQLGKREWLKTMGGMNKDWGYDVKQTYDGGYIIVGFTNLFNFGTLEVLAIKTDSFGDTLWTKSFSKSEGSSVEQTSDSGFIFCGGSLQNLSDMDVLLFKTDIMGNLVWSKTYGGVKDDYGNFIKKTSDNNFLVIGGTRSFGPATGDNVLLLKINNDGDTIWSKAYHYGDELGLSISETTDGGFILASSIRDSSSGTYDMYIIKTDSSGNAEWAKTYEANLDKISFSIKNTKDGRYILTGGYRSNTGPTGQSQTDIYTLKLNSNGDTLWTRLFGRNTESDLSCAVEQTSDSGYVIFANSSNFNGNGNFFSYLIKTDANGNTDCSGSFNQTLVNNAQPTIYSAPVTIGLGSTEKQVPTIIKDIIVQDSILCIQCGNIIIDYTDSICKGEENAITVSTSVSSTFLWYPIDNLSCYDCPDPVAAPDTSMYYYLTVEDINECKTHDSIFIKVDSCSKDIFIPNIFSPNGDGINESFIISGIGISGWTLSIFNRWGQLIFDTNEPSGKFWGGTTFSGAKVNSGLYYYVLTNETLNFIYKGSIQLVR